MQYKSVMAMAMHDIAESMPRVTTPLEVWLVRPTHLDTKLNKRLNRRLGLHKLNK